MTIHRNAASLDCEALPCRGGAVTFPHLKKAPRSTAEDTSEKLAGLRPRLVSGHMQEDGMREGKARIWHTIGATGGQQCGSGSRACVGLTVPDTFSHGSVWGLCSPLTERRASHLWSQRTFTDVLSCDQEVISLRGPL